tara:strand:- start:1181 stop:1921 length:741 start_codon:yes stop_codon:yes gene_type:complete
VSEFKKSIFIFDDQIGRVEYVDHMGTDLTVVNSARVSFGVQKHELSSGDIKLVKYLIKHKHTSTLEHCSVTLKFTVPLYIRSQHMRHRTWSYNEISRRYTDKNYQFYTPKEFRTQHESNRQASDPNTLINPAVYNSQGLGLIPQTFPKASELYLRHCEKSLALFDDLIGAGVCREQARGVLPQTTYTEYYGTVNLNNLLKFISLRIHEGAQWEIAQVAKACLEIAKHLYPISVSAYEEWVYGGKVQ